MYLDLEAIRPQSSPWPKPLQIGKQICYDVITSRRYDVAKQESMGLYHGYICVKFRSNRTKNTPIVPRKLPFSAW